MNPKETIETYIADNSPTLGEIQDMTYADWLSIVGDDVSMTAIKNNLRPILKQMLESQELGNLELLDQGELGDAVRAVCLGFGYTNPDVIFNHKKKYAIIRLMGAEDID
jgi:hypothetical protein